MKSYQAEIEDLFSSTGEFAIEWRKSLDNVELKNQRDFLEQLHQNILTERSLRSLFEKEFGVGVKDSPLNFRYSALDYEVAQKSKPLHSERLLKDISNDPDSKVKYRATRIFHDRKIKEIKNEEPEIERILGNLRKSEGSEEKHSLADNTRHLFHDIEIKLIELPSHCTREDLGKLFRNLKISEEFQTDADYQLFKSNSFKLFSEKDTILPIGITIAERRNLASKIHKIYSCFKKEKSDYPKLNLRKEAYAKALLANIKNYQESKTSNNTFEAKVKQIVTEIR